MALIKKQDLAVALQAIETFSALSWSEVWDARINANFDAVMAAINKVINGAKKPCFFDFVTEFVKKTKTNLT